MARCPECDEFRSVSFVEPEVHITRSFTLDPYCSKCGKRVDTPCSRCGGKGYILAKGFMTEYCSRCGKKIEHEIRQMCPRCLGSGHEIHLCW